MSLASLTLNQIIIMFVILVIGIVCYKFKIIDEAGNKLLSNVLLLLVSPFLILVSYQRDFSKDLLNGLLISFILAIVTHVVSIVIVYTVLRGKRIDDVVIERFSVIFSNCGFMGIPLVNGIFGSEGVFYITAYITVFNLFLWTFGVFMMTKVKDWGSLLKAIISPNIIAIIIGLVFFLLQIRVPDTIYQAMNYIGSMNTPLAMLIAGVAICSTDMRKILGKSKIYLVTLIKLMLLPIILLFLYSRFPIDNIIITTAILAAACPTATTSIMFALRYDKNATYASEFFVVTTLLSAITIPFIMMITENIL